MSARKRKRRAHKEIGLYGEAEASAIPPDEFARAAIERAEPGWREREIEKFRALGMGRK